jgi:hypothetical protein
MAPGNQSTLPNTLTLSGRNRMSAESAEQVDESYALPTGGRGVD